MWFKHAIHNIEGALQKGLHVGQAAAAGVATAKGLYDAGRTVIMAGRAIAPYLAAGAAAV